jgi:hypothetical protein
MNAAISKWIEDLVKDPDKALELLGEINRAEKDPGKSGEIVVGGKHYKVRLAGTASASTEQK